MRRSLALLAIAACLAVVVGYQVTRPARAESDPRVFVPSAQFFEDFSPSFRSSIADAYYLYMVQYYGEHIGTDQRLDSMADLVDLVTRLSPRFTKAYQFGTFALLDADEGARAYEILQRGVEANPEDWGLPALAGFLVYGFGEGETKNSLAAEWYARAAAVEGSPIYLDRLAATLTAKGGETEKAALMWAQVYADGDKYSREKAVAALDGLLPEGKEERMEAVAPLAETMPEATFEELLAALFEDYL
ncbi:MAG: hypothetical protein V2J16_08720 [Thermoleophilia bacterium]|nr:hypothetical protein [Thermoleophilia bacterium]